MFAYCLNNPIVYYDDGGNKPKSYDDTVDNIEEDVWIPLGDLGSNGAPAGFTSSTAAPSIEGFGDVGNAGKYPVYNTSGDILQSSVPPEAYDIYDYLLTHNGTPPKGYKGGTIFANDGRANSAILPGEFAPFQKFDIYPKLPGVDSGLERIIIGSGAGGAAWYTPDHYKTVIQMTR